MVDSQDSNNIDLSKVSLEFRPRKQLASFVNDAESIYWLKNDKDDNYLSENLIIHGDNLASMAALRVSWLMSNSEEKSKYDMIYIDPPYNVGGSTGYKNTWKGESEGSYGWAGDHGKFLDFMEPRLKMAKLLMNDKGLIFVSICDAEYPRLLMLMSEIFGDANLIGTYIWDKKQGSPSQSINVLHEYIICFAKNKQTAWTLQQLKPGALELIKKSQEYLKRYDFDKAGQELRKWIKGQKEKGNITSGTAMYNKIHPKTFRVYRGISTCAQDDNGSRYKKPLKHPITGEYCPVPSKGWKWKKDTLHSMVDYKNVVEIDTGYICGDIIFGKDHTTVPQKISYLDEKDKQQPSSIIRTKSSGANDLPPGCKFSTPKPIELLEELIGYFPSKDIKILDFFAGSGTTAHAVHKLNEQDNGNRTYTIIEAMESTLNDAILPRMKYVAGEKSFSLNTLDKKEINSGELLKVFHRHAVEFIKSLHSINNVMSLSKEGINLVGINEEESLLTATINSEERTSSSYFRKELSFLANTINTHNIKHVIVYRIETDQKGEEPWVGIKQDIFAGTSCESFKFVSLPSAITKEWKNTLIALEAI